jgi:hypothetical protein
MQNTLSAAERRVYLSAFAEASMKRFHFPETAAYDAVLEFRAAGERLLKAGLPHHLAMWEDVAREVLGL